MMLTERVRQVQPQQLHDGAKLQWCKCGRPGLALACHTSAGAPLRQACNSLGSPCRRSAQRRISSTASGLSEVWRRPARPNTHVSRETARGLPFAIGSHTHTYFPEPLPRQPPLRSQRVVVPPPPRRLIDRESLETCNCETHAFPPQIAVVRIAAHRTTYPLHTREDSNVAQWTSPTETMASRTIRLQRPRASCPQICLPH